MIASIDVFDTALTRLVGQPDSLFLLLGYHLADRGLIALSPELFARSRRSAEALSRCNAPNGEPTIAEIYETVRWMLGVSAETSNRILQEELALESRLLRGVPSARAMVEELQVATGREPVFLSDTYLPSDFLRGELARLLGIQKPIELMVSCEWRKAKRTGELFSAFLREHVAQPEHLLHFGNDAVSDGSAPARLGIRTRIFKDTDLDRYEAVLESHRWETGGVTSLFAGASRMARLRVPSQGYRESVIRDVAAGVAAPVLVSYVLWTLRRASELNIKRLYFVSRDGEVLLDIASSLRERLGLDIELRYLYGSRQAWHLPAVGLSDRPDVEWLLSDAPNGVSVDLLAARLGLSPTDFAAPLARHGFSAEQFGRTLDTGRCKALLAAFSSDPEIVCRIRARATEAREPMLNYLRQEGLMESVPFGLVDLGWSGRMFDSLWAVLKQERAQSPIGFLFGWCGSDLAHGMCKEGYIFDSRLGIGYKNLVFEAAEILETFCAGSHGMVWGYTGSSGDVRPIFKERVNEYASQWGMAVVRNAICAFLKDLVLNEQHECLRVELRPTVRDLLSKFWNEPTWDEAVVWGCFRHFTDQTESGSFPLARPYGCRQIFHRLIGRPVRNGLKWQEGSLRLTPTAIRWGISVAGRVRGMGRPLGYLLRQLRKHPETRSAESGTSGSAFL
jgi:hypothetical protein